MAMDDNDKRANSNEKRADQINPDAVVAPPRYTKVDQPLTVFDLNSTSAFMVVAREYNSGRLRIEDMSPGYRELYSKRQNEINNALKPWSNAARKEAHGRASRELGDYFASELRLLPADEKYDPKVARMIRSRLDGEEGRRKNRKRSSLQIGDSEEHRLVSKLLDLEKECYPVPRRLKDGTISRERLSVAQYVSILRGARTPQKPKP